MEPTEAADHLAIARLKNEYCHRIDSGDYEGWVDLFVEDGVFDAGEPFQGTDELLEFAEEIFDEEYARTAHIVTNPVIEVDGDRATGRFYLYLLVEDDDGSVTWRQSRYHDEYERVDGQWRISSVSIERGISA